MKQLKIHPKVDKLKTWHVVLINTVAWAIALALIYFVTHLEKVQ